MAYRYSRQPSGALALRCPSSRRPFTVPQRMNNKKHDGNGDAGIGDIEGRPGMGEPNMQIEKKKIDHVPVKKTIGKISKNSGEQKCQRRIAPKIG